MDVVPVGFPAERSKGFRDFHKRLHLTREDALRFRMRITVLREQAKAAPTKEERERFKRRILELQQLQRQSRELAELTRHYYERGYCRNEKYTL